jgi:TIR domain
MPAPREQMSEVFISYKREDKVRVGRLVQALERQGLSVWWDRELPGGESWRANIEAALDKARCVVVVWTQGSVGTGGSFVRDEAGRAARKGLLVPVLLDKVDPPLGFGETQAIDLTRWRGKVSDPFFQDLVDAARARIAGRPAPAPFGPIKRLRRRLTAGAAASVLLAAGAAFANNVLQVQNRACVAPVAQPGLSDLCGALGLGARPVRDERLAWAAREEGKCDGLRTHLQRFPSGAYRDTAQALLNARSVVVETSWKLGEQPQPLRLLVGRDGDASIDDAAAKARAIERGTKRAEQMCRDFDAAGLTRLQAALVEPQEWQCSREGGGVVCGFEGKALCRQEHLQRIEKELCIGKAP